MHVLDSLEKFFQEVEPEVEGISGEESDMPTFMKLMSTFNRVRGGGLGEEGEGRRVREGGGGKEGEWRRGREEEGRRARRGTREEEGGMEEERDEGGVGEVGD